MHLFAMISCCLNQGHHRQQDIALFFWPLQSCRKWCIMHLKRVVWSVALLRHKVRQFGSKYPFQLPIPGSIAILGYQPSSSTHLSPSRANPHGLSPQARARHLGRPMKLIMGLMVVRLYPQGGKASSMTIINPSRSLKNLGATQVVHFSDAQENSRGTYDMAHYDVW